MSYPYLHWINNPPKVSAATCGTSSAQCSALGSAEHPGSAAAARWWCSSRWRWCTCLPTSGVHRRSHAGVHGDAGDQWHSQENWRDFESLQAVARTILIKSSDGRVYQHKSNLKIEIDGISVPSANWHIRLLQQLSESLSILQHSWFLFPELDLLTCLLSKGLFLIFVELYLKCVFFWLLMFSFLHSGSQAGAQVLTPGPQIYSHRFDGLSLVLPVSQSTWMGRLQTFAGTAVSAVETILLAVEAQFHGGGAHISCLKCVKPHQSSVIRPTGIFPPPLSSWSTFSHSSKSYFCFFSKSLMYLFWLLLL